MTNEEYERLMIISARRPGKSYFASADFVIDSLKGIELTDNQIDKLREILHKNLTRVIATKL